MLELSYHRGPDAAGSFFSGDGRVAMGNTRLAIVDPHNNFEVPVVSKNQNVVLTFNGEIYNYAELRKVMRDSGQEFRTQSDTEVLVEGLAQSRKEFLKSCDGFWGLGAYFEDERTLLLARDLMGERHVFYYVTADEIIFASEPKPILAVLDMPLEIDLEGLTGALTYHAPPPSMTLVKGLKRLLPGRVLELRPSGEISTHRLLKLQPEKWFDFFQSHPSEEQVLKVFEETISQACNTRVPQEVPFFSTLSGGIDSTLVASYAARLGERQINTLHGQSHLESPQSRGDNLSEFAAAELTSGKLGTKHHSFKMFESDCTSVLENVAANSFDGVLDAGIASFQMLAREIRRVNDSKVLLLSDGPDELMGGYLMDFWQHSINEMRRLNPFRYGALALSNSFTFARRVNGKLFGKKYVIPEGYLNKEQLLEPIHNGFSRRFIDRYFEEKAFGPYGYGQFTDDAYDSVLDKLDFTQRCALAYADTSLPDMFNLRTDRALMAQSVECRLPMQAPALVELFVATPSQYRYTTAHAFSFGAKTFNSKRLLRKLVDRRISPDIANRFKYGFSAPIWRYDQPFDKMKMQEVVLESEVFKTIPLTKFARESIHKDPKQKIMWALYSLAKTGEQLISKDF